MKLQGDKPIITMNIKTYSRLFTLIQVIIFSSLFAQEGEHPKPNPLKIGAEAPDFKLPGVDGKEYTLSDFSEKEALVIIFSCNHCPTAQAYEDRIIQLTEDYKGKSVQVVVISPNAPNAVALGELGYSDLGDSFKDMQTRAKEKNYNFPYLYDGETQEASLKYGPIATPHAFLFNKERKLSYVGRLDGSEKPGSANAEDLRSAINAVLANKKVSNPITKTFGCSVKWAWKNEWKKKLDENWAQQEVTLNEISPEGIKQLIKNDTDKLRLINVWATWCGPCVMEFPEFVDIHRMYMERDFEFISISADKPEKKEKVLAKLERMEAATQNYLFSLEDKYQLIEAIDENWQGALPYTILVEPGGKILYSQQGTINPYEIKKKIVESKYIGRYY
ncbi:redoxin domain-containing protein [Flexithrix dorotheae]|uniref:redoxin domain-containing protein n=1 Tax=Flexithrix dorotheae TaxID=70993 RepID=UPI00038054AC|nr:redoxin domain-containing protein [Flexithrix dorotheae]